MAAALGGAWEKLLDASGTKVQRIRLPKCVVVSVRHCDSTCAGEWESLDRLLRNHVWQGAGMEWRGCAGHGAPWKGKVGEEGLQGPGRRWDFREGKGRRVWPGSVLCCIL